MLTARPRYHIQRLYSEQSQFKLYALATHEELTYHQRLNFRSCLEDPRKSSDRAPFTCSMVTVTYLAIAYLSLRRPATRYNTSTWPSHTGWRRNLFLLPPHLNDAKIRSTLACFHHLFYLNMVYFLIISQPLIGRDPVLSYTWSFSSWYFNLLRFRKLTSAGLRISTNLNTASISYRHTSNFDK